jgi:hypothetical protein
VVPSYAKTVKYVSGIKRKLCVGYYKEALLLQGFFVACDSHQKKQTAAACCDISIYIVVGSILQTDCSANDNDQASPYVIGRQ